MINYKILHESIEYYEKHKFVRIEVPWTVSEYVSNITKPVDAIAFKLLHNEKCLVGSAEQSFLYLYLKEFLPSGQFQSVTPCFRSDKFDNTHTKYFMKNELIKTDVVNEDELMKIVNIALEFFQQYLPESEIVQTKDGYDIEIHGNELGSYGIRECDFLTWIYGTACAEPRLSTLIKKYKK